MLAPEKFHTRLNLSVRSLSLLLNIFSVLLLEITINAPTYKREPNKMLRLSLLQKKIEKL